MTLTVIITCEHGGNGIPRPYRRYFSDAEEVLESHRGWDAGSLPLARALAGSLNAGLYFSTTSRLLVDLNRSAGHPRHFSEFSRRLTQDQRDTVEAGYYAPYRSQVTAAIETARRQGKTVLHVSVHSFTPLFAGKLRTTDFGLLYDPERESEARFVELWRKELQQQTPDDFRIHRNQPYRGTSDGFTTRLRQLFPAERYLGIELELSQKWLTAKRRFPKWIERNVIASLNSAIRKWETSHLKTNQKSPSKTRRV